MERVAISENRSLNEDLKKEIHGLSKMKFNVDAKEFIPRFLNESALSDSEQDNGQKAIKGKTEVNSKSGENKYKPVFMDGMTEKFIEGPYMGNGRDPEIPYIKYYSNGQTIDFFNKKYFSNSPTGEVVFKPYNGSEEPQDSYQAPVYLPNCFMDRNIFRPPIIDALVEDLLWRQRIASAIPKTSQPFYPMNTRRTIKNSNLLHGGGVRDSQTPASDVKKEGGKVETSGGSGSSQDSMHEEWLEDNVTVTIEPRINDLSPIENPTASSTPEKTDSVGDLTELMKNLSVLSDEKKNTCCTDSEVWEVELPKEQRTPPRRSKDNEDREVLIVAGQKTNESSARLENGYIAENPIPPKIPIDIKEASSIPDRLTSNDPVESQDTSHNKEDTDVEIDKTIQEK